jgi:phosphoglucosamine mutase
VCRVFAPLPQTLRNVRLNGGDPMKTPAVQDAIRAAEAALAGGGRLLVRKSGTEPVVRVMAEGEDEATVKRVVDDLVATIARAAG